MHPPIILDDNKTRSRLDTGLVVCFQLVGIVTDFQVFVRAHVATVGIAGRCFLAIDFALVQAVFQNFRIVLLRTQQAFRAVIIFVAVNLAFLLGEDEPLGWDAQFVVGRDFIVTAPFACVEAALFQLLLVLFGTNQVAFAVVVGITVPDFALVADTPRLAG